MVKFINYMLILAVVIFNSMMLMADENHCNEDETTILVKGGGTFVSPNLASSGFNATISQFHIKAVGDRLVKGMVVTSSQQAAPIDPVTGENHETRGTIDAVRVFAEHPDIVWIHGIHTGFFQVGTEPEPGLADVAGETIFFNRINGEFIAAVTTWGRTTFSTVAEVGPLPDFFTSTELELISLVKGFDRILLTTGAEPGRIIVKTTGKSVTIRR